MTERKTSKTETEIINVVKPIIENDGFYLVECCFVAGKDPLIRIYVYNKENMPVDKLGELNRKLYPVIQSLSLGEDFSLEVSSPGIYRKFKYLDEFGIFIGRNIRITTSEGKTFSGINEGVTGEEVVLIDKKNIRNIFNLNNIKNASLDG